MLVLTTKLNTHKMMKSLWATNKWSAGQLQSAGLVFDMPVFAMNKYFRIPSAYILVTLKSTLSQHKFSIIRPRGNEHKHQFVKFDPYVQRMATYVEHRIRKNLRP